MIMMQQLNKWLIFTLLWGFGSLFLVGQSPQMTRMQLRHEAGASWAPSAGRLLHDNKVGPVLSRHTEGLNSFDRFLAWKDAATPRKETARCACVQEPAGGSRRMASSCWRPQKRVLPAAFLGVVKAECPHRPSRSDNSLSSRLQLLLNAAFQE